MTEANAIRDRPVQKIARTVLKEQVGEDLFVWDGLSTTEVVAGCTEPQMELEVAERRLELKRKTVDWDFQIAERRIDLAERWMEAMEKIDPKWREDDRLQTHAKDLLCSAATLESLPLDTQSDCVKCHDSPPPPAPERADKVWQGRHCEHGRRRYRCALCSEHDRCKKKH